MRKQHNKNFLILLLVLALNIFLLISPVYATTRMAAFGTNKYDGDDDLPGCDNDARDVYIQMDKKGLIELEGSDSRFGRVTKQLFKDSVERVGATLKKGDTLIIYNSSHGTRSGKICTSDGYISSEELASYIAKSECSNVLIVNDSCFSGKFRVDVPFKNIVQINSANPARLSYTSLIESRLSGRINGVFSKFFLESLDPRNSDKNGDGNVTAIEILEYVNHGMFVKEHAAIKEYLRVKYADNYKLSITELEAKIQQATNNYNWSTTDEDRAFHEGWKDWWEFIRDVKLGKEGMRWQSPTLRGDKDFIVVAGKPWKQCINEKIAEGKLACKVVTSLIPSPATGEHVWEEPYCLTQPFEIKIDEIHSFMRTYRELARGSLPYEELEKRIEKLYSRRRKEEWDLMMKKFVEDKAEFVQGCGNCKLKPKNNSPQGGTDYDIVCMNPKTGNYDDAITAYNCHSKWERIRFKRANPEVEAFVRANRKISALLNLFKALRECGYKESYWEE